MSLFRVFLVVVGFVLVSTACALPSSQSGAPTQEIRIVEVTSMVPATCPPTTELAAIECSTPVPEDTPESSGHIAKVDSSSLTLRAGPSSAHNALGILDFGSEVTLLGKAPGGGWVVVSAAEGRLGWLYTPYLDVDLADPMTEIPEVQPTLSWVIPGRVLDSEGNPIEDVFVAAKVSEGVSYPVMTDSEGQFFLFAPQAQSGPWEISINGVSCLSRVANQDCYLEGFVLRNPSEVYVPGQEAPIEFVYEVTTMTLNGNVEDEDGNAIADTAVFAARRDGAYVTGRSDSAGAFEIPITPGSWRLWARGGLDVLIGVEESGYLGELVLIGKAD